MSEKKKAPPVCPKCGVELQRSQYDTKNGTVSDEVMERGTHKVWCKPCGLSGRSDSFPDAAARLHASLRPDVAPMEPAMSNDDLSKRLTSNPSWDWNAARGAIVHRDDSAPYIVDVANHWQPGYVWLFNTDSGDEAAQEMHKVDGLVLDISAPSTHGVLLGMAHGIELPWFISGGYIVQEDIGEELAQWLLRAWGEP